eukprot:Tbor_TRINITY_DN3196_c0_g1::TRINITY_DN3196_c0_g1_i1::g.14787::m.14787
MSGNVHCALEVTTPSFDEREWRYFRVIRLPNELQELHSLHCPSYQTPLSDLPSSLLQGVHNWLSSSLAEHAAGSLRKETLNTHGRLDTKITIDVLPYNSILSAPPTAVGSGSTLPLVVLERVPWLPYSLLSYRVPKTVFFANWKLHKEGCVLGMDPSSIASVVALMVPITSYDFISAKHPEVVMGKGLTSRRGRQVLDMCCSPGMKLKLISEVVSGQHGGMTNNGVNKRADVGEADSEGGVVVGVDVSMKRLFAARSLLTKYSANSTILCAGDSRVFCPDILRRDIMLSQAMTPYEARRRLAVVEGFKPQEKSVYPNMLNDVDKSQSIPSAVFVWSSPDIKEILPKPPVINLKMSRVKRKKRGRQLSSVVGQTIESNIIMTNDNTVQCTTDAIDSADHTTVYDRVDNDKIPNIANWNSIVPDQFDNVLLDVECTHDGSLSHLISDTHFNSGSTCCDGNVEPSCELVTVTSRSLPETDMAPAITFQDSLHKYKRHYALNSVTSTRTSSNQEINKHEGCTYITGNKDSPSRGASELQDLQLALLKRAYYLAKPWGTIVYSTCSYDRRQNEGVLELFFKHHWQSRHTFHGERKEYKDVDPCFPRLVYPFGDQLSTYISNSYTGDSVACKDCGRVVVSDGSASSAQVPSISDWQVQLHNVSTYSQLRIEKEDGETHNNDYSDIAAYCVRLDPSKTKSNFQFISKIIKVPL